MRFEKPINEMTSNQAPETTEAVTLTTLTNRNTHQKRGVILAVLQSCAPLNFHGLDFGVVLPDIYNNN